MLPAALLAVAFLEEYCKVRVWLLLFGIFTIFYKLTDKSWGTSTSSGRLQGESLGIVPSFKKSITKSISDLFSAQTDSISVQSLIQLFLFNSIHSFHYTILVWVAGGAEASQGNQWWKTNIPWTVPSPSQGHI